MTRWILALILVVLLGPTRTPMAVPTFTPQPAAALPPTSTANPLLERCLVGVESLLRHSAKVLSGQAIGMDGPCESRYIIAFPYLEPDRSGGMTLAVISLERAPDGTVQEGTHTKPWNVRDEGLYPFQWRRMLFQNRSVPGRIQIEYRLQGLVDSAWISGW